MPSSLVGEINKPIAINAAFGDGVAEEALVAGAKAGDELAFETLVKRHQGRLFALALRYTRVREDAEDIVQKTFQKAFLHLHEFEGKSLFATWLTRIAINEALMFLRRGHALREVSLDDSTSDYGIALRLEITDQSPDPETSYLQRERARHLSGAIGQLRPGTRTALELRELLELSTRETARRMGLSVGAVKGQVYRGRKSMRERLRCCVESTWTRGYQMSGTSRKANGIPRQQFVCSACD